MAIAAILAVPEVKTAHMKGWMRSDYSGTLAFAHGIGIGSKPDRARMLIKHQMAPSGVVSWSAVAGRA